MKNLILFFTLITGSLSFAQAQGDITIYSNTGNKFYVILNGIRQNTKAETNVKVTGLTNEWYDCKIMAENNSFTIEKKIPVKFDTLITYSIIGKKGKYKMRYLSETPLGTATAMPDQSVITYHPTETPVTTGNSNTSNVSNNSGTTGNSNVSTTTNTSGNVSTTTTTTTTSSSTTDNGYGSSTNVNTGSGSESVNVNISISENPNGASFDMNVTGTGDPNRTNTTMSSGGNSTITTTTSSSSSDGMGGTYYEETSVTTTTTSTNGTGTVYSEETTTTTTTTSNGSNSFGSSSSNTNNQNMYTDNDMTVSMNNSCYISDTEVDEIAKQVADESFSDDQARIGNMAALNKCMSTAQIIKIANSFSFEDNKLEFLKKAYNNCTDRSNYFKAMETLTFSGDKEELENYINSNK